MKYASKNSVRRKRPGERKHTRRRESEVNNPRKSKAAAKSSQRGRTRVEADAGQPPEKSPQRVLNPGRARVVQSLVFPPGSPQAVREGCTCPVLDNHHGSGFLGLDGMFVYNSGCPLHWEKK